MQIIVGTCRKTLRNSGAEFVKLSARDLQMAHLVCQGRLNKEISGILGLTEGTVKIYMSNLFAKLGVGNRAELAAWTVRHEAQLQRDLRASSELAGVLPLGQPSGPDSLPGDPAWSN